MELERLREERRDYYGFLRMQPHKVDSDYIVALEAEVEALRVCGSCKWCGSVEYLNCEHDDVPEHARGEFYVSLDDRCHHDPSRWTRRKA